MTMRAVEECPHCHSHNIKKNGNDSEFIQAEARSDKAHGFHAFRRRSLPSGRTSDRCIRADGMSMEEKASGFGEIAGKLGIIGKSLRGSHLYQRSRKGKKQGKEEGTVR